MAVTFNKDTNTLTFPSEQNREWPINDAEGHKNAVLRTKVDIICIDVRKVSNPKQLVLTLNNISQTFFTDLENWFLNICKGKLYSFKYSNDVTGENAVVTRLVNGFNLDFDGSYFAGQIILEKEL